MSSETQTDVDPTQRSSEARRPPILIVDDNRANLVALDALLSPLDVDIVAVGSGEEALRQLLARDFALVLMDVQMPGLDGFQTTALIRQRDRSRHTPIIFLTAIFVDAQSIERGYQLGALDFLAKPFDEAVLRAKVAALTNHYRQLDVIERQAAALQAKQHEAAREHAAREEAEAANRAKDQFLAILSHELRAPLTAIVGWSSLLQARDDLPEDAQKSVEAIARNARAQQRLIDDLLDLSQIIAGKIQLSRDVVDLTSVTQSALATMAPAARQKRIRFDLDVAPAGYAVVGDARRLEQLVCALVSNAIKFSPSEATVRVELSRAGGGIQLRVKDTGCGIGAELLPHVFERFRQGDGSWSRPYGGLGIGLTIARHLAELHDGSIQAFSAGEDMGAVFVVTLPPYDAPAASARTAEPARVLATSEQPLGGLRLLVVDDDEDARELLSVILDEAGATVVTAAATAQAVALFDAQPFDVVISDLGMPGEDGLALVRKLRARPARFKAIALSGYGSDEDRAEAARAGFDEHITKPVDRARLVEALVRLTRT